MADDEPTAKRRRVEIDLTGDAAAGDGAEVNRKPPAPRSLERPISPPARRVPPAAAEAAAAEAAAAAAAPQLQPSPFQLTAIRDLPPQSNVGAVSLSDILGDPLISECWEFNYLHDVDFLVAHLDPDVRSLVKVHVVHGFWKREDPNRMALEQQASQYDNVSLHTAFMPEMFGTHHTKMMVLLRHDETAQVVIHTANMIAKDWTNMTNGLWRSPRLPRSRDARAAPPRRSYSSLEVGSGDRFGADLLSYLRAYNARRDVCGPLVSELARYDFSGVRAAFVASVPGKHDAHIDPEKTLWGWAALRESLKGVPVGKGGKSEVVVQVSSIATLGPADTWLTRTLFGSLSPGSEKPDFSIIFPTPDEIRRSLDGYASGGSIHMKTQSAQQIKQLQYMKPMLCHWANDSIAGVARAGPSRDAGRARAAPHIKTYIRWADSGSSSGPETAASDCFPSKSIEWALLTSANISKQAWGEAVNAAGDMRIASWEAGVLVWPDLLAGPDARMIATFGTDQPDADDQDTATTPLVGLRVPYSLPLQKYSAGEEPWVATRDYKEPDWMGNTW